VRAITPEQVQAVAQKYLISERLTVGHLQPVQVDAEAQSKGDEHNG
jgi:zinc protease